MRVPDDVRRALGVVDGGGVTFIEGKDGLFYMLGDAQVLDMIEPGGRDAAGDRGAAAPRRRGARLRHERWKPSRPVVTSTLTMSPGPSTTSGRGIP